MENRIFTKRVFLNKEEHHFNAALVCYIEDKTKESYGNPFWGLYKISNCDRGIELSMDLGSEEDLNNTIYKLEQIINTTKQYKKALKKIKPRLIKH